MFGGGCPMYNLNVSFDSLFLLDGQLSVMSRKAFGGNINPGS